MDECGEVPGAYEQVTRERVDTVAGEVRGFRDAVDQIWKAIDRIRIEIHEEVLRRLPPWVMWVIATMTTAIGGMAVLLIEHGACFGK